MSQTEPAIPALSTERVAGLDLARTDPAEAVRMVASLAARGHAGHIHLVNAYTIALADRDRRLQETLQGATANFPDGVPLTWWSRFKRGELRQVRGNVLFRGVLADDRVGHVRHFLLGSTPETLERLEANIRLEFPDADLRGSFSPPFRDLSRDEVAAQDRLIRGSGANLVWVGLGTPKQDFAARDLAIRCGVLSVAVGAAFDFGAGTKTEAPAILQQAGLEWLYRLAQEPRRLWRRYLIGNLQFLRALTRRRQD